MGHSIPEGIRSVFGLLACPTEISASTLLESLVRNLLNKDMLLFYCTRHNIIWSKFATRMEYLNIYKFSTVIYKDLSIPL